MCYKESEGKSNCPITNLQIISEQDIEIYRNDTRYTLVDSFRPNEKIAFSKTAGDNLPLVRTAVQNRPCVDPSQNSDPSVTYSLEVDRAGCSKDPQINLTYDERYINTGSIGISEWAMQDDSDVLDKLIALPHY